MEQSSSGKGSQPKGPCLPASNETQKETAQTKRSADTQQPMGEAQEAGLPQIGALVSLIKQAVVQGVQEATSSLAVKKTKRGRESIYDSLSEVSDEELYDPGEGQSFLSEEAYVQRQGGTRSPSLMKEISPIMAWAEQNLAGLTALHVPGVQNIQADFLSRNMLDPNEWSLNPAAFRLIAQKFGNPEIDLMASSQNHKCQKFFSRSPCRDSVGVDALLHSWSGMFAYVFPPFRMIWRVLKKIDQEKALVIAVVPHWPRRPWYPLLRQLTVGTPLRLPPWQNLLAQGPVFCEEVDHLSLMAWKLKGRGC
eukprot:XP_017953026.1 PREDICTED: uncharacterized protein LOC108648890 [Xenopus tropicalis]